MRENGKNVLIADKEITLTKRFVEDNKTIGFEAIFRGNKMRLPVQNLVVLCGIFKPVDFTVAVRDSKVIRKDPNTGKPIEVMAKKPYLVGINGNKLTDLPVVKVSTKKKKDTKSVIDNEGKKDITEDTTNKKSVLFPDEVIATRCFSQESAGYGLYEYFAYCLSSHLKNNNKDGFLILNISKEEEQKIENGLVSLDGIEVAQTFLRMDDNLDAYLEFRQLFIAKDNKDGKETKRLVYRKVKRCLFKDMQPTELSKRIILVGSIDMLNKLPWLEHISEGNDVKRLTPELTKILGNLNSSDFPINLNINTETTLRYITVDFSKPACLISELNHLNTIYLSLYGFNSLARTAKLFVLRQARKSIPMFNPRSNEYKLMPTSDSSNISRDIVDGNNCIVASSKDRYSDVGEPTLIIKHNSLHGVGLKELQSFISFVRTNTDVRDYIISKFDYFLDSGSSCLKAVKQLGSLILSEVKGESSRIILNGISNKALEVLFKFELHDYLAFCFADYITFVDYIDLTEPPQRQLTKELNYLEFCAENCIDTNTKDCFFINSNLIKLQIILGMEKIGVKEIKLSDGFYLWGEKDEYVTFRASTKSLGNKFSCKMKHIELKDIDGLSIDSAYPIEINGAMYKPHSMKIKNLGIK